VTVPFEFQAEFLSLFGTASTAAEHGLVAASHKERQQHWRAWSGLCEHRNLDPELQTVDSKTTVDTLQAFAELVRGGSLGQGRQVGTQTVEVAPRAIHAHFKLAAKPNLCYKEG
jgi:hypothetical protein